MFVDYRIEALKIAFIQFQVIKVRKLRKHKRCYHLFSLLFNAKDDTQKFCEY